jgi:hypothetical protein
MRRHGLVQQVDGHSNFRGRFPKAGSVHSAPAAKGNSSKKVDTSKPPASKVVSARSVVGKGKF